MKYEFRKVGLAYSSGTPPGAHTLPPAAASTAWPAAVSHSIVLPSRGYRSASPAATRQNLSDDPAFADAATVRPARNASSASASPCERLETTVNPSTGQSRQAI